ncbi:MAG: pilin [Patescibacteria group bacterium]
MLEKGSSLVAKAALCGFVLLTACVLPVVTFAQTPEALQSAATVATEAGLGGETDLPTIIGRVIYVALGFVGVLLLLILLYAGYLWMTAGGDATKVEKAQAWIRNGIIGLVLIASSFAITSYILGLFGGEMGGGGIFGDGSGRARGSGFPGSAGSLGGGIIEFHAPPRDATGVPRNTAIAIQFKVPINPASMIAGWTEATSSTTVGLNSDAVKIFPTGQATRILGTAEARVRYTDDLRTFIIKPVLPLGNPTRNTGYTVRLMSGSGGIRLKDGGAAFEGGFADGYLWNFEVSTILDNTPPRVESVFPVSGGQYAPNIVVQVNFDEMIDPTSAAGIFASPAVPGRPNFQNIEVAATPNRGGAEVRPNGEFKISNHFTTVEFTTNVACGTNSCGESVYCLPFLSSVRTTVKAATLVSAATAPEAALTSGGYDGIVDLAGNSLDGNGDGTAQGSRSDDGFAAGVDHYEWTFGTGDQVNLTPPHITSISPSSMSSNIAVDAVVRADFQEVLKASSILSDNVKIVTNEPAEYADTFWFTPWQDIVTSPTFSYGRVIIDHRLFTPSPANAPWTPDYDPFILSGVQNLYQNCFNPASSVTCASRRGGGAATQVPFCCDDNPRQNGCPYPPSLVQTRTAQP